MKDVWKWVAITVVAFMMGGGGGAWLGRAGINEDIQEVQDEMDDRSDYTARIHMSQNDDIEDLEKLSSEILQRLTKIETLLEAEIARHHP